MPAREGVYWLQSYFMYVAVSDLCNHIEVDASIARSLPTLSMAYGPRPFHPVLGSCGLSQLMGLRRHL